jgi:hypothetical protein
MEGSMLAELSVGGSRKIGPRKVRNE